jgi:hypothetical protein
MRIRIIRKRFLNLGVSLLGFRLIPGAALNMGGQNFVAVIVSRQSSFALILVNIAIESLFYIRLSAAFNKTFI